MSARANTRLRGVGLALLLGLAAAPAGASEVYRYKVQSLNFGEIGSYTDTITRRGDSVQIDSRLRVQVRMLGIVLHREEADRTEVWRDGRMVRFDGVTIANSDRMVVHGEAQGDRFIITGPAGTVAAAADVKPSNPWMATEGSGAEMMSTKTGKLETVRETRADDVVIEVRGAPVRTRHYVFMTNKRQEVWKDAHGVPVRFLTAEPSGPIDFVLVDQSTVPDPAGTAVAR